MLIFARTLQQKFSKYDMKAYSELWSQFDNYSYKNDMKALVLIFMLSTFSSQNSN